MRIIDNLAEMIETARGWLSGGTVSLVLLTSTLHKGHKMLIQVACDASEICVVCIIEKQGLFDIPATNVGTTSDLVRDLRLWGGSKIDVVFIPRAEDMYPLNVFSTYVTPTGPLIEHLEMIMTTKAISRLATTMTKLLQLVRPDIAFFGQKDALQVAIIRQLVRDLNIDVNLQILPTVRENDGLAVSGRHLMLTDAERLAAPIIYQSLCLAQTLITGGERQSQVIIRALTDSLATTPLITLEQITVCHVDTFVNLAEIIPGSLIVIRAHARNIQLIDNIVWMG
jgi:pantoate--beta-alanine ligase